MQEYLWPVAFCAPRGIDLALVEPARGLEGFIFGLLDSFNLGLVVGCDEPGRRGPAAGPALPRAEPPPRFIAARRDRASPRPRPLPPTVREIGY